MENKDAQLGEWKLETNLVARLIVVQVVSYAMFGARGNGIDDDGVYIKQAHDFANMHRLPVVNVGGEYWLSASHTIHICTNVEWGARSEERRVGKEWRSKQNSSAMN